MARQIELDGNLIRFANRIDLNQLFPALIVVLQCFDAVDEMLSDHSW